MMLLLLLCEFALYMVVLLAFLFATLFVMVRILVALETLKDPDTSVRAARYLRKHRVVVAFIVAMALVVCSPWWSQPVLGAKGEVVMGILFDGLTHVLARLTGIRPAVCYYGAVAIEVVAVVYAIYQLRRNKKLLLAFVQAVGDYLWERRHVVSCIVAVASLTAVVGAKAWEVQPKRHQDYWCVPDREPVPREVHEAKRFATAIAKRDVEWSSEMDKITALIDAERAGAFDLYKEVATTEALRAYVDKLLRLGESAVVSLGKMKKTAHELDVLLKEAPARYRQAAKLAERFRDEATRNSIKEKYSMLADIYEAKAKAAELHHKDVENNLNSDLEDYLKDENVFLERLLTLLNQGLAVDDLRDVAEFTKTLEEVVRKHDFLRDTLRTWRERVVGEAAEPRPRPVRGKDGARIVVK